ncbi:uncharacterized protein Z518_09751 [Rhinocladiella mackenziei CBS 650.93]|uniref:FAD-binding PCMH-type domain-containing protein n=1 Tax=Rhinocladiella mackenziei CBS 650.93 TaxID=1442369 RepID=A0A0D2IBN1_9EURO|nr:uncharacterized protein Z518_09751 [Rhinocladiella mackenziei CBS 650.93]KIX00686.1 hypothetical protein Z518_09751 [Rhinocladiella mackenziei CBS 650.93]
MLMRVVLALAVTQAGSVYGFAFIMCCELCNSIVAAGFQDRLLYPGSEGFEARMASTFSLTARVESCCIVQPLTPDETSMALTALINTEGCNIGVRSGGHGMWAGANYIADGVTIDFGNMNSTTYNAETNLASIQPRTNWGSVYNELQKHGVTVPGGRASTVGVAGFLTGGGNSFFAGKAGFGCDNVVNFEVVLADGSIVNANRSSNPDLWLALRGGHGNLGLVTRFDMAAIPSEKVWGGVRVYANSASQQLADAFTSHAEEVADDPASATVMFWSYQPMLKMTIVIGAIVNTDGNENAPALKGLMSAEPMLSATSRITTHSGLTDELEQPSGYHFMWIPLTYANTKEMNSYAVQLHDSLVEELKTELGEDADFMTYVALQALNPELNKRSVERGGNLLGLDRWDTPGVLFMAGLATRTPGHDAAGRVILLRYLDKVKAQAKKSGALRDWLYINYGDPSANPIPFMGEKNLATLKAATLKYDPTGVFQTRVLSGFKLPVEDVKEEKNNSIPSKDEL